MFAFAATGYYQKINRFKIKIVEKWCHSDNVALGFFLCNVVWSPLGNITQGFGMCKVVPRVLRHYWYCYLDPLGQHCTRFLPVPCCPKSIKTPLNRMFPVQCCLEALGQNRTRLLPVQSCPKRIKTTLNRIFSCAILSGASRTTLSRVFICAMLPQENWGNIEQDFFSCATLSRTSWATLHKVFNCAMSAHG